MKSAILGMVASGNLAWVFLQVMGLLPSLREGNKPITCKKTIGQRQSLCLDASMAPTDAQVAFLPLKVSAWMTFILNGAPAAHDASLSMLVASRRRALIQPLAKRGTARTKTGEE